MNRIKRLRPTPALLISALALFVALGGGAFAASAITSADVKSNGNLKKGVVGKKELAKNAVVKSKIKNNAVTTKKLKNGAATSSKLGEGSVKASQVGSITEVVGTPTTVLENTIGSATVSCPADTKVISGGYNTNSVTGANVGVEVENRRSDNGWRASIFAAGTGDTQLTAYAYCLEA